jgi:c-di-GMP-binding flagellar brake protein YcgR
MNIPLKPSQLVQVLVTIAGRGYPGEARIIEVGKGSILITVPSRQGIPLSVHTDYLTVTVPLSNETLTMCCRVLSVANKAIMLALPVDAEVRRIQRRRFVRVGADLTCTVKGDRNVIGLPLSPAPARLLDLSEGGCAVMVGRELAVGSMIKVQVKLPNHGDVELFGRVKRCRMERSGFGSSFTAGLEFMNDTGARSQVVQYVRWVQLEEKRKERTA